MFSFSAFYLFLRLSEGVPIYPIYFLFRVYFIQ